MARLQVLAALVATTTAEWQLKASCSGPNSLSFEQSGGIGGLYAEAREAIAVKICTRGLRGENDCVESNPMSFPIMNLRNRIPTISHVGTSRQSCNQDCVAENWNGYEEKLGSLWSVGGSGNPRPLYQAWGNQQGLHMDLNGAAGSSYCLWRWDRRDGQPNGGTGPGTSEPGLDLLFNMATVSPTSTPTRSPTRWYQAPGHRQNVSQLQDTVAAMQSRMDQLERDATTFATQSAVDARLAAIGDRVTLVDETVTVGVSNLATLLGTVNASLLSAVGEVDRSVGAIRAALREAAVPATGGTPVRTAPSVGAVGDSVVVKARGTIRVESASCAVDGLCEISAFASRLQAAVDRLLR